MRFGRYMVWTCFAVLIGSCDSDEATAWIWQISCLRISDVPSYPRAKPLSGWSLLTPQLGNLPRSWFAQSGIGVWRYGYLSDGSSLDRQAPGLPPISCIKNAKFRNSSLKPAINDSTVSYLDTGFIYRAEWLEALQSIQASSDYLASRWTHRRA